MHPGKELLHSTLKHDSVFFFCHVLIILKQNPLGQRHLN
ncbi:hypothetical protein CPC1998_0440 [Chlamydia psittaci C19/98]|nr:hypothetical protein CPC1998_0440 [Chlamydia psittaci C19/98]